MPGDEPVSVRKRPILRQQRPVLLMGGSGRPQLVSEIKVSQLRPSMSFDTAMAHLLGYARVSTTDQNPHLQVDALRAAGCYRVFVDKASGTLTARPELDQVLDPPPATPSSSGNCLGRSLRHLVDTVAGLHERQIG